MLFNSISFSYSIINSRYMLGTINCVRWNQYGDMLTTASNDKSAKLLDFNPGKVIQDITSS